MSYIQAHFDDIDRTTKKKKHGKLFFHLCDERWVIQVLAVAGQYKDYDVYILCDVYTVYSVYLLCIFTLCTLIVNKFSV